MGRAIVDFVRNLYSKDYKNSYNSMKFEDYISGQHIQSSSQAWLMPISKKHTYAILSTAVLAICSSFFVSKTQNYNLASQHSYEEIFVNEKGEVVEPSSVDIINPTQSLAEVLSSHYTKDKDGQSKHAISEIDNQIVIDTKGDALDNYDDNISDQLLADADTELDKKIRDKTGRTQSSWFVEDIASGDTLSSVFSDLNIPYATLEAITSNKDAGKALSNLRTGYSLSFLLDEKNNLLAFVKQIDKETQIRFYRDNINSNDFTAVKESLGAHLTGKTSDVQESGGAIVAESATGKDTMPPATQTEEIPLYKKRGRLVLVTLGPGQAFSTAAHESGLTYNEIAKITDLFKGRIQFTRHLQPGDTMRVLFSDDKGEGKINAIEFNLARLGKLATFRHLGDDKYYDEKGYNSASGTFRRFPINGKVIISSHFNPNRRHPVTGQYRPHNGTDFAVRIGTPIVAPADGVVDIARYSKGAGYYIVLRHRGNYSTVYMHLSKMNVKPGQRVKAGSIIARSGNTGMSTGPHLHYELRINNKPVNAMRVKLPSNSDATVVAKQRQRFESNVATFKKDLHNEKLIAKLE